MAKIHKSTNVSIQDTSPVVLDMPAISKGLRDLVFGEEQARKIKHEENPKKQSLSVENLYVQSVIEEANNKANQILTKAKSKAAQIVLDAQEKYDESLHNAQIEGLKQGVNKTNNEFNNYLNEASKYMDEQLSLIKNDYEKNLRSIESDILNLSIAIAQKVICHELDKSDEAIKSIVKDAISKVDEDNTNIYVQRTDKKTISELAEVKEINANVIGRSEFKSHECIIETSIGRIDAGWKKKLDRISEQLKGEKS